MTWMAKLGTSCTMNSKRFSLMGMRTQSTPATAVAVRGPFSMMGHLAKEPVGLHHFHEAVFHPSARPRLLHHVHGVAVLPSER